MAAEVRRELESKRDALVANYVAKRDALVAELLPKVRGPRLRGTLPLAEQG